MDNWHDHPWPAQDDPCPKRLNEAGEECPVQIEEKGSGTSCASTAQAARDGLIGRPERQPYGDRLAIEETDGAAPVVNGAPALDILYRGQWAFHRESSHPPAQSGG